MLFFKRSTLSAPALLIAATLAGCNSSTVTPSAGVQSVPFNGTRAMSSTPQFSATALPAGFIPVAIMKDGAIPGRVGHHAAIFRNGTLTMLPDFPACSNLLKGGGLITATSSNIHGEVVGFCNGPGSSQYVGVPLYYKNGSVERLRYPHLTTLTNTIVSMAINDSGVVVGAVNVASEESSGLYQLYPNGAQGIGSAYFFNDPINDQGYVAATQFNLGLCCAAAIANLNGKTKYITSRPCSESKWINDNNLVVGNAQGCGSSRAFVYANGSLTFLPAPASDATGVNDANVVIGALASGIFLYANGVETSIGQDITPAGKYRVEYFGATGYGYLGGLSDNGAFVATTGFDHFYLVTPVSARF